MQAEETRGGEGARAKQQPAPAAPGQSSWRAHLTPFRVGLAFGVVFLLVRLYFLGMLRPLLGVGPQWPLRVVDGDGGAAGGEFDGAEFDDGADPAAHEYDEL